MYERNLEAALRNSAQLLTQTEKDRDGWKTRCAELERKIKAKDVEISTLKATNQKLELGRLAAAEKFRSAFEESFS